MHRRRGRRLNEALDARSLLRYRTIGFGLAILVGVGVAAFGPSWLRGTVRGVAAYDAAAAVALLIFWTMGLKRDAVQTRRRAAVEDPGRNVVLGIVLVSCLVGLASAIVILGRGANVPAADRSVALAIGLLAVLLGWILVHSSFTFRYAHLYYVCADRGGQALIFPGGGELDDYDFAYFSFVIGMTFQVSDVQIADAGVRRLVLLHGLISFAYNTTILALVINLASGLLSAH